MVFQLISHPIRWLFLLHAFAGSIALLIFLVPLISKKGGKLHIKSGWVYIYSMVFVSFSSFIITPWRILADPQRSPASQGFAVLLFFISILTISSIWFGLRVLKFKNRTVSNRSVFQIGLPILLIMFGVITQVVGFFLDSLLLMIFPLLGYKAAHMQLKYWIKVPIEKRHWWYAHVQGMGTSCIATITAFLVTALPRIFESSSLQSPILWIAPGVIGGILLNRTLVRYRKQFGDIK